jgi:hypothetical protein
MKNKLLFCCLISFIVSLASCGSSPYKKRKGCNGHGGWYKNRNLSKQDTKLNQTQHYVWSQQENKEIEL